MEDYYFGTYQAFAFEPTTEQLETAKGVIVEELCNEIRRLSQEHPEEFFITKDTRNSPIDNSVLTIGAKLIVPNMKIK